MAPKPKQGRTMLSENDGTIREILNIVNGIRDTVQDVKQRVDIIDTKMEAIILKVDAIDKKVDVLAKTLDDFRADTQDEFSIIKARLRKLEGKSL